MKVWIHVHASGASARRICWYVGTSDAQVLSSARLQLRLRADAEFLLRDGDGDLVPITAALPHDHHFSLVLAEHVTAAAAAVAIEQSGEGSAVVANAVTAAAAVAVAERAASNKRHSDSILVSAADPVTALSSPESNDPQRDGASTDVSIPESALTTGELTEQQQEHKRRKVKSHSLCANEHAAAVNGGDSYSLSDIVSSAIPRQPVAALPSTNAAGSPQSAPAAMTPAIAQSPAVPPARARSIATIVTQFLETFTKPILNDDNVNFIPNTGKYGLYALYSEIVEDPSFHPKGQDAFYKMTAMQGKVDRQRVIRFYQDQLPEGVVEYVQYKPQGKGLFLRKYLVVESERAMHELVKSASFVALMDLVPEQVVAKYLDFVRGFQPISKADYRARQNGDEGFLAGR